MPLPVWVPTASSCSAGEGKHFSAGADLQWMQRAAQAPLEWNLADARKFAGMLATIEACPKPTVARVQGAALGGGVGLACACDIAAADNANFSVSEAKFGILPAVIGPYVMNAVGKRQARRLALTATRIGAAEALAIGLVQQVCPLDAGYTVTPCWANAELRPPGPGGNQGPVCPDGPEPHHPRGAGADRPDHQPRARHARGPRGLLHFSGQAPGQLDQPGPTGPRNTP